MLAERRCRIWGGSGGAACRTLSAMETPAGGLGDFCRPIAARPRQFAACGRRPSLTFPWSVLLGLTGPSLGSVASRDRLLPRSRSIAMVFPTLRRTRSLPAMHSSYVRWHHRLQSVWRLSAKTYRAPILRTPGTPNCLLFQRNDVGLRNHRPPVRSAIGRAHDGNRADHSSRQLVHHCPMKSRITAKARKGASAITLWPQFANRSKRTRCAGSAATRSS